jgi:hypothetical protein
MHGPFLCRVVPLLLYCISYVNVIFPCAWAWVPLDVLPLVGILGCNEKFSIVLYLNMFLNYCHLYEGIILYLSFFFLTCLDGVGGFELVTYI